MMKERRIPVKVKCGDDIEIYCDYRMPEQMWRWWNAPDVKNGIVYTVYQCHMPH